MTTTPEPTVQPTHLAVSCLPEDHADHHAFSVQIEYRRNGRWAVTHWSKQLGRDGTWSWGFQWGDGLVEPDTDAEITDYDQQQAAWLADHRFDYDTAVRLAKDAARALTCRDLAVADVLAGEADQ